MPDKTKELNSRQKVILGLIVEEGLESISYHHPEKQLGKDFAGDKRKTLENLRSLESEFGVLRLDPDLKFGFLSRCGYHVDLEKAGELYDSIEKLP